MTTDTQHQPDADLGQPGRAAARRGVPLSYAQEQLWFLDQLSPDDTTYNILLAWRLHGADLDPGILSRCLDLVVARHASLRTTVHVQDGAPFQVAADPAGSGPERYRPQRSAGP